MADVFNTLRGHYDQRQPSMLLEELTSDLWATWMTSTPNSVCGAGGVLPIMHSNPAFTYKVTHLLGIDRPRRDGGGSCSRYQSGGGGGTR